MHVVFCFFLFLVVSNSAIDCLERLVSEMTYYVSSDGTLNPRHSLTLTHSSYEVLYYLNKFPVIQSSPLLNSFGITSLPTLIKLKKSLTLYIIRTVNNFISFSLVTSVNSSIQTGEP